MPKLKDAAEDLNEKELEEAEYTEGQFEKYDGEIPATGTLLRFRVTKMWWTYSQADDPMLKVLCVAEDNEGDLEEYDGLPCWENLPLTAAAKFKWFPFLDFFGLTIRDIRTKTIVADEDDNQGAPIEKIGSFVVGSDDALFVGMISKERYQGKWQAHIKEWLDSDTELDGKPKRSKAASNGSRRAATQKDSDSGRATGRRRSQRDEEPEEEAEEPEEEPEETKPRRSRRAPARKAPARSSTRGRRSRDDDEDQDEPPF
jgi:hypothetical protein